MKKHNIYILFSILFFFSQNSDVFCQDRTSASVEISIKIVKSLSTSISNEKISKTMKSSNDNTLFDREVMIRYSKRISNHKNLSRNNSYLAILNRNSEKISSANFQNTITIKNLSKFDELKFVPQISESSENLFPESSITIIY